MKKKNLFHLGYEERRGVAGYAFISPWLIGVIVFFVVPFVLSLGYAFCDIQFIAGGLTATFTGLKNFKAMFVDTPETARLIFSSVGGTLIETVFVLVISIFLSMILNQEFKGRGVSRVIFSLPIIVSSGLVLIIFKNDLFYQSQLSDTVSSVFQGDGLNEMLKQIGLSEGIINTVVSSVNSVVDMLWKCGVQILLFISALQSISPALYEVCDVEGATAWQRFWKVTFPMITPFILLNLVYTVIDSFTYYGNGVMTRVLTYFEQAYYSYSIAMALGYFVVVIIILGIATKLMSRHVYYIDK